MFFEPGYFERNPEKLGLSENRFRLIRDFRNMFIDFLHKHYPPEGLTDSALRERVDQLIIEMDESIENIANGVPPPPGQAFEDLIRKTLAIQQELAVRKAKGQL